MDSNTQDTDCSLAGLKLSPAQVIALTAVAAATAAIMGITTYLYLLRKSASNPQSLLGRCREAIDQIERGIEGATHA